MALVAFVAVALALTLVAVHAFILVAVACVCGASTALVALLRMCLVALVALLRLCLVALLLSPIKQGIHGCRRFHAPRKARADQRGPAEVRSVSSDPSAQSLAEATG